MCVHATGGVVTELGTSPWCVCLRGPLWSFSSPGGTMSSEVCVEPGSTASSVSVCVLSRLTLSPDLCSARLGDPDRGLPWTSSIGSLDLGCM